MREPAEGEASGWRITGWMEQVARTQLDVAFDYPIRLPAGALGPPARRCHRARPRPGPPGHRPRRHGAGRLAPYKRPRTVDFTAEMPRDPNGKLYERRLREPYWEGRTRPM